MPIYEFECPDHGVWNGLYRITDEDQVKPCEQCGKPSKKIPSRSTFELRGEGWYANDKLSKIAND